MLEFYAELYLLGYPLRFLKALAHSVRPTVATIAARRFLRVFIGAMSGNPGNGRGKGSTGRSPAGDGLLRPVNG